MKNKTIDKTYYIALLISLVIYLPFIVLAGRIHPVIHDQLDGDLITYIMQARDISLPNLPQFMDGTKTALTMPAPGFVVLFMLLDPLNAYKIMQLTEVVIGVTGMYLLARRIGASSFVSVSVSVLFITIPFYMVYGLSIMGLPLLTYALLCIAENQKMIPNLIICSLYAVFSSLVLVGYCVIIILSLVIIALYLKRNREVSKRLFIAILCIVSVYGFFNLDLFVGIIKPVSLAHREEFLLTSNTTFKDNFWNMLKYGTYHEGSNHLWMYYLSVPMFIYSIISIVIARFFKKTDVITEKYILIACFMIVFGISLFYAFWHSSYIVSLRGAIGGVLKTFQLDRFYFMYPLFWYLLLVSILTVIGKETATIGKSAAVTGIILQILIIILCGFYNLENNISLRSDWNNVSSAYGINLFSGNLSSITWDDFWDAENFNDVSSYIKEKYGTDKDEYRVVSVGLYPSVPLYNGFYCADGYSNNYTLDYKHKFGEIIYPELIKSTDLYTYFFDWGNRCYIFSSELNGYYFDKNCSQSINDLSIDTNAAKGINITYIISAVPIDNYEDNGLEFEDDFGSDLSNYHLYLYRLI